MRLFSLSFCLALASQAADFNREIRPLLANKCYTSWTGQGGAGSEAAPGLNLREGALKNDVIVPGKVAESEPHHRIRTDDPKEIMPPPKSKMTLTAAEKDLLDEWIAEGAPYDQHWAFVQPGARPRPSPQAFTMWMAGGGIKPGITLGKTDELGFHVAENPVHVHELQATILRLPGIDHTHLSFRFQGLDFRLTDVEEHRPVAKLMA
jgi:hypothetical protein